MEQREILHILIGIIVLAIVISFESIIDLDLESISLAFAFALIIIATNIFGKKLMASSLDSNVEHEIWTLARFGFKPDNHLKKGAPFGVLLPIIVTAVSLGFLKLSTIFTYKTKARKARAAKRFGFYSFTEMTEWHNALVGAAGISATLLIVIITYFIPGLEGLPTFAAFYALFNLIPFSKLDGAQIFYGSRTLWSALAIITIIAVSYSFILV